MSERNLMIAMAAVAILACIPQIPFAYWPLVLVVIGLVYGGMHAEDDLLTRLGYIIIAAALPLVADNLDSISFGAFAIGPWVNSFLDNIAIGVAGIVISNTLLQIYARVNPADSGSSADGGGGYSSE